MSGVGVSAGPPAVAALMGPFRRWLETARSAFLAVVG